MKCECRSNRPIRQMLMVWFTLVPWFLEIHWEAPGTKVTPFNFQYRHRKILLGYREGVIDPLSLCQSIVKEGCKQQIVLVKSWDAHSLATDSHPSSKSNLPLSLELGSFLKTVSRLTHSLCFLHPIASGSAWSQPCIPRNWIVRFSYGAGGGNHN